MSGGIYTDPEQVKAYRKLFQECDLNNDGVVSAKELKRVSLHTGYRLSDEQLESIMLTHDLDRNGQLTFEEFLNAIAGNTKNIPADEHRLAQIRRKFHEFDEDGNGVVSADEAHEILRRELAFTPEQSAQLVSKYDKNGDGELSYEEFVRFYSKVQARSDQIRKMFAEFDKDGSGSVSVEEAKLMLTKIGMTAADVEQMVAEHDTNQDGELQYEEFVAFLLHR